MSYQPNSTYLCVPDLWHVTSYNSHMESRDQYSNLTDEKTVWRGGLSFTQLVCDRARTGSRVSLFLSPVSHCISSTDRCPSTWNFFLHITMAAWAPGREQGWEVMKRVSLGPGHPAFSLWWVSVTGLLLCSGHRGMPRCFAFHHSGDHELFLVIIRSA